jgi:hypothetical protein
LYNVWNASGLTNDQKHAQLKAALAAPNPRQISSLVNSEFDFPTPAALSTATQAMQEMLNMLPRKIADRIPDFHLRFDSTGDGGYDGQVLSFGCRHWGKPTWLPHVWHELAHAIYVHAPDPYKATLARHFRVRTQGEQDVPVGPNGEMGREDRWLPNSENPKYIYAGKIYRPHEVIGAGLELPSEYMSYMQTADGADFAFAKDRETMIKVLSIFFWGRTLK